MLKNISKIVACGLLPLSAFCAEFDIEHYTLFQANNGNILYSGHYCYAYQEDNKNLLVDTNGSNVIFGDYMLKDVYYSSNLLYCDFRYYDKSNEVGYVLPLSPEKSNTISSSSNIPPYGKRYSKTLNSIKDKELNFIVVECLLCII